MFSTHILKLPIVLFASEALKQNVLEYKNLLVVEDTTIPDLFTLHEGWIDEKSGIGQWPPLYITDILKYADVPDSNVSKEIFLYNLPNSKYAILRSKCTPSQRIKDEDYKLWICLSKETGSIKSTYCTYTAG